MATIPCTDYFDSIVRLVPTRIKRTNPNSIKDRWANFCYSMDLSPQPDDDEIGNQYGAWSLWDLPVTHCAQYVDEAGNDLIVVAIGNRVYKLDWTKYRDEWEHNTFAPIYRMIQIGPIPHAKDEVAVRGGYDPRVLKRLREFQWSLVDAPESGNDSKWRVSVGVFNREDETWRVGMRAAKRDMRLKTAVKGLAFAVRLEHCANEPMQITNWSAEWDMLGRRTKASRRTQ
jgi:hypothetical protein